MKKTTQLAPAIAERNGGEMDRLRIRLVVAQAKIRELERRIAALEERLGEAVSR